nr:uncharacterized protein LOC127348737 [Lolium perenne]
MHGGPRGGEHGQHGPDAAARVCPSRRAAVEGQARGSSTCSCSWPSRRAATCGGGGRPWQQCGDRREGCGGDSAMEVREASPEVHAPILLPSIGGGEGGHGRAQLLAAGNSKQSGGADWRHGGSAGQPAAASPATTPSKLKEEDMRIWKEGDPWATITGEYFWKTAGGSLSPSTLKKKLQEENALLLMELKGLELQLEKRKAENKKLLKKHSQELRRRDWRECVIVCLFSVCLVLVAMISVR